MFEGENKIVFNEMTLKKAVAYYLENEVLKRNCDYKLVVTEISRLVSPYSTETSVTFTFERDVVAD